jgi:hypothetical protein
MAMVDNKPSIESQLPLAPGSGLTKARAHGASERINDHETILATVSTWDSNFVVVTPLSDGDVEFGAWMDIDAVHAFYENALFRQDTLEQYPVNELNGTWHQFTEAVGNVGWHSDGQVHQVHVAVLFPVWVDGIIGEICWKAPEWAYRPFSLAQRVDLNERLSPFDEAWRSNDVDAMAATVADGTSPIHSVIRVVEVNGDRRSRAIGHTKDELRSAWSAPEAGRVLELERVNQIITNWYVFASYRLLLEVSGRRVVRESARILPVGADGMFIGELSYSMETDA